MDAFIGVGLSVLGAWFIAALWHAYTYLPVREMRRRSAAEFKSLVSVARFERSVRWIFGLFIYVLAIICVVESVRDYPTAKAVVIITVMLIGLAYFKRKNIRVMVKFAVWLAKYLNPLFRNINPILDALKLPSKLHRHKPLLTELYEKDDLKQLIKRQKLAANNRIPMVDLEAALHALEFEHKKISAVMVPYERIHFVTAKEPIGPILLSELHKSGYSCFPVKGNSRNEVIGMLHMDELAQHTEGGVVVDAMDKQVVFVREDQYLEEVLKAFAKTGKHIFMVIDSHQKLLGLITVRDVLEQIVGHSLDTEFEDYGDTAAVAQQ